MTEIQPTVNTGDRLSFAFFLALAVHALFILGIGFEIIRDSNKSPIIEVTLAQNPSRERPEDADYMAEQDQIGGGDLEENLSPSIMQPSEFIGQELQKVSAASVLETVQESGVEDVAQLVSSLTSDHVLNLNEVAQPHVEDKISQEISLLERSLELASLDAKIAAREQWRTKDTRTLRVSSVSALAATDAYYVKQWIQKIHRVGKLNYPAEARQKKIYGALRLVVSVLPSGSVRDIRVLRSSGHKILDDAAVQIVRLAEPFAPFTERLKKDYDVLEITRTWAFSKEGEWPVL